MRFIYGLLVFMLALTGCQNVERPQKPDHLLDEDQMTDILYDIAILKSIKTYNVNDMRALDINPDTFIYKKYDIDSLQLARNISYYAVDFNKYAALWKRVSERVSQKQEEAEDEMTRGDSTKTLEIKKRRDSIKKSQKKPKEDLEQVDSLVAPISG